MAALVSSRPHRLNHASISSSEEGDNPGLFLARLKLYFPAVPHNSLARGEEAHPGLPFCHTIGRYNDSRSGAGELSGGGIWPGKA